MITPLRTARLAAGLTGLELADLAATLENRVFQIERGRFRARPDEARRLAAALKKDPEDIFPDIFPRGKGGAQ